MEADRLHSQRSQALERLDEVLHLLDRKVPLKLEADVACRVTALNLPPAVLNDGARLDGRHGKGLGLHFQPAGPDNRSIENRILLKQHDAFIRPDGSARDVVNGILPEVGQVHCTQPFFSMLREYLDAKVVGVEGGELIAIPLVMNFDFPKDRPGVGVFLDQRLFHAQNCRVNGLPIVRQCG